ncbi:MAG TPA: SPOR domain-containing protein [Sphingopyxis sp.]|nr:SPOR domain-containing protein [Sphingopyxis sp.]HMQ20461.1 SPOR domain-containing protein [Sphingopyxis sp.]
MNRNLIMKLAVSGFVLGLTTTGCSMGKMANAPSNALGKPETAVKSASQARAALEKGKTSRAVGLAEAAVSASPRDGQYRALLGQAYLNDGRFASAAAALEEATELGVADGNTVLALILANLAQGKTADALALINRHRDTLPAPDAGLALALAGDTNSAIYVLGEAARAEGATARTRQNLALAYALSGRWAQARIIAAQDLSPAKIDARMAEWDALAREGSQPLRVASLIGVKAQADAGMPVRLALANFADTQMAAAPAPVELAAADPVPPVEAAPAIRTVELPMPQRGADGVVPVTDLPAPAAAPVILADATPYRSEPQLALPLAEEARALVARFIPQIAAFDAKKPSGWAVQLGAYDSLGIAKEKWGQLQRKNGQLASLPASSHAATVKGRTFHRLTVNGIRSEADARRLCSELRADGQACFVRRMGGSESIQWAAAPKPVQLASR